MPDHQVSCVLYVAKQSVVHKCYCNDQYFIVRIKISFTNVVSFDW